MPGTVHHAKVNLGVGFTENLLNFFIYNTKIKHKNYNGTVAIDYLTHLLCTPLIVN